MTVLARNRFLGWLFGWTRPVSVHQLTMPRQVSIDDSAAEFVTLHLCSGCGHKHRVRLEGIGACRQCPCTNWSRQ